MTAVRARLASQQAVPVSLHIRELRSRLIWSVIVFFVGSVLGYINQGAIINLMRSFIDESLYYTSPAGNFNLIMKISVVVGAALTIPVLVYNLLRFIQPAIDKSIRYSRIWLASIASLVLAMIGITFALFIIIPIALHFFGGFSVNGIEALISADSYLDFIIRAALSFAVLFQIPLLLVFINHIRPIPPRKLLKYERHVIVAAFVVGLLLPFAYDPVTQLIIATPIILLYNLSILFIWISSKKSSNVRHYSKTLASTPEKDLTGATELTALDLDAASVELEKEGYIKAAEFVVSETKSKGKLKSKFTGVSIDGIRPSRNNPSVSVNYTKNEIVKPESTNYPNRSRVLCMDMVLPEG